MITAARKPSTLGPSPKLRVGHKHALRQFSINLSVPTSSNIYIQRKKLNEKTLERNYITYEEIMQGGVLEFDMTSLH